jgi:hypothetical protein
MKNEIFGLSIRIRKWTRKAFLWISKHTTNEFEAGHYFWLAMWNGRPYSWRRIESHFGFRGKPLNLKNWR